jgi:5-methylthioadenosine/S-adenosylhomocysteine deaminase
MKAGIVTGIRNQPARDAVTPHSDGIILPGPIDLHGHPEFNVFARREPPRAYVNRYAWRNGWGGVLARSAAGVLITSAVRSRFAS